MRNPYLQGNRGITRRYVSASGLPADEVSWQYSGGGGSVNITAPDGSLTALSMYTDLHYKVRLATAPTNLGRGELSPRTSIRPGRKRRKAAAAPASERVERYRLECHQSVFRRPSGNAQCATHKRSRYHFDTGGPALAKITAHEYDTTYQFSTGVNETATNEYDYVVLDQTTAQTIAIGSVPTGALLRRTEKTYLDATNQAYRDRNLLALSLR